jgi:hypothetical protein
MKTIKDTYSTQLNVFLGVNVLLIYLFLFGIDGLQNLLKEDLYKSAIGAILPLIAFVLNGIAPVKLKNFLVFWRIKKQLPANRAFSVHMKKDERIDEAILQSKYPKIGGKEFDENKLWYKIYQKYQDSPSVWDAQKGYLFARDMTTLSMYFLLIMVVLSAFDNDAANLIVVFLLEYFILMITSRVYASRFVRNVLALESVE